MAMKAFVLVLLLFLWELSVVNSEEAPSFGPLVVAKESRRIMVNTESGMIAAVDVQDGSRGAYHLQFITMEPSSLFLPVLLHTDMVFFVHTGRGRVSYAGRDSKESTKSIDVERGDVYRLEQGTVFYVQSYPSQTREKLRIHAIFNTVDRENLLEPSFGPYSNITDLVRGFDERVLQMGFGVSEEVIRDIKGGERTPSILPYTRGNETEKPNWKEGVFEALIGVRDPTYFMNKKKKTKTRTFNFYSSKPDEENCYGWSTAVTHKDLHVLKGSNIGVFMVNLTTGSMMAPHWNPKATEIAIVVRGQGMVQVVCPTDPSGQRSGTYKCENSLFRLNEGDVFVVPKYHPMAQISFNNDSFVFVGFSTNVGKNHPQFLAGSRSVLQVIDREILAISFNAANTTVEGILASQNEAIILGCTSCAEELESKMEEEIQRQRQEEEARRREEEEARKRQEEEEAKRREEEEEARRREEEEEARRREEEEEARRRQEEEEARRREQEEEEARRREEEQRRQEEEEEEEARQQEETRRREEEEARRRQEEEEATRRREQEEEEARREEEQRRQEEEEAARQQEEEEARRREEEEARRRQEEEEATRRREQEEEEARREEEQRRQEEEEEEEEEEEAARQEEEEEARKREEEQGRGEGGEEEEEEERKQPKQKKKKKREQSGERQ
ncbi:LOW QUALITY PROTEIN: vicilin-like seed storage protein At4g36700 [Typha angustifolia]|uniref:LOW QUALITY PROTEIN: vicilin-like seed storage protein At4g36700 n=1 Tax=Typha angustifolia TaxID=59011 RepID=UPI003C2B8962